jgi:hypothetical protein
MKLYTLPIFLLALVILVVKGSSSGEQIRILAVDPTPEPKTVVATIQVPAQGAVKSNPVWVQIRVDGYALGSDSQFDKASELVNSDLGQTIHVVVDNLPYFPINGPSIEPFNEDGWYYNQSFKFELPKLSEGLHTLRIFPARSYGESLKGERTFHDTYFFVGAKGDTSQAGLLEKPFLTYNEPSDQFYLVENKPVLLDFYLSNAELSPDGYKVKLTIDGQISRMLTSWQPYYIYGLKKGKHTMRLELLDSKNKLVAGSFNDTLRHFVVH